MNTFTLFLLALGLSMDAFAVSVSNSMCHKDLPRRTALVTSLMFGLFQGMMPVIGYVAGRAFADAVSALDHWIAFVLLGYIGGKMLVDAVREWNSEEDSCPTAVTMGVILTQAVATSIDATSASRRPRRSSRASRSCAASPGTPSARSSARSSATGRRSSAASSSWASARKSSSNTCFSDFGTVQ